MAKTMVKSEIHMTASSLERNARGEVCGHNAIGSVAFPNFIPNERGLAEW